jgi:hypothetical protein
MSIASRITISLLTLGLVSVASCTGSGSTDFEGTWTYNPGSSATVTCPTGTNTLDAGGNEDVRPGTDSDLVVISSDGCNIKFNATGNRADAIPGQSCTSLQSGVTTTTTFNNASYTMQDDVLSFTAAGTIRLMGPGGEVTCTMAASATLRKVSN